MTSQTKASNIWKPKSLPVYETTYGSTFGYNERQVNDQKVYGYINRYDVNPLNIKHKKLEFVLPLYRRDKLGFRQRMPRQKCEEFKEPPTEHPLFKSDSKGLNYPQVARPLDDRSQFNSLGFHEPKLDGTRKIPDIPSMLDVLSGPPHPVTPPTDQPEPEGQKSYDVYSEPPQQAASTSQDLGMDPSMLSNGNTAWSCTRRSYSRGGLGQTKSFTNGTAPSTTIRSFFEGY
mmetsp:Transcript_4984/g.7928  ORF Transcript_4984/g.7928 Transcript_4984/m.7928 type:complete len:231 (+) Transcript_4984:3-695(+)